MLDNLKKEVYEANMLLEKHKLVVFTWGNVSGIDRERDKVVIKPSGISYNEMSPDDMVIVDLLTGETKEGSMNPSSDTATHLELYRNFSNISGIAHTHSRWATTFAQARLGIPPLGTTHADYFYGEIPCTRLMTDDEILSDYELATGKVIVETFKKIDPLSIPAVLVASHGPFTWGKTPSEAVHNSVVLEELSFMAWHDIALDKNLSPMQKTLLEKHYKRKHGENAYYGQK